LRQKRRIHTICHCRAQRGKLLSKEEEKKRKLLAFLEPANGCHSSITGSMKSFVGVMRRCHSQE
jgi:hypothetical protein